jgi:RimJ/RimL family protein N-acetyltransferase
MNCAIVATDGRHRNTLFYPRSAMFRDGTAPRRCNDDRASVFSGPTPASFMHRSECDRGISGLIVRDPWTTFALAIVPQQSGSVIIPPDGFETERLNIRAPILEDARAIFQEYARDPHVTKYLVWRPHRTIQDTAEFLTKCYFVREGNIAYPYSITLRETTNLIGMIEMRIEDCRIDLGYVLAEQYWNKGYMTEAVKAFVAWGLAQEQIHRVWAYCDIENIASSKVLEKVGMHREGILRKWVVLPNLGTSPRDCYAYSIVK